MDLAKSWPAILAFTFSLGSGKLAAHVLNMPDDFLVLYTVEKRRNRAGTGPIEEDR